MNNTRFKMHPIISKLIFASVLFPIHLCDLESRERQLVPNANACAVSNDTIKLNYTLKQEKLSTLIEWEAIDGKYCA